MMAAREVKIGVFALAALVAVVVIAVVLGIRAMAPRTIAYHTYFDESVQGLELGSPVRYRGVRIGTVEAIGIAPDRKHVDVTLDLNGADAERLGLAENVPGLRALLGVQGITGLKFVEIDFFDPAENPAPVLPFRPAARTIPSRRSLINGLTADVESLSRELPKLGSRAGATLDRLDRVLDDIHDQRLVERLADAADRTGEAAAELRRLGHHVDSARLPEQTTRVLAAADRAVEEAREAIARVDGDRGLIASARRATDSLGDLGRTSTGSAEELARTLRELGDAARAVRELAEEIDRNPEILVKGRARSGKR